MADFESKYSGAQVEALLDQVASGNAGGGGGTIGTYVADFTMQSLLDGMSSGGDIDCNIQLLVTAMRDNKIILVRESEDDGFIGTYVLNGYIEDLLYFSIVDSSGNVLWCEGANIDQTASSINPATLHYHRWDELLDNEFVADHDIADATIRLMVPNKKYYIWLSNVETEGSITIEAFQRTGADGAFSFAEFNAIIKVEGDDGANVSLYLPDVDILWANDTPPLISFGVYELSIIRVTHDDGYSYYNGVFTKFIE